VTLFRHLLAEVLQHIVHDAYDSELVGEAEMQATKKGICLISIVVENDVLSFCAHLRGNVVAVGVEIVPFDDAWLEFDAMRTEGGDAVAVVVAAVAVADNEVAVLAVEAAVPVADYAHAAALAASEIDGSSRYFSNFQENLRT